MAATTTLELSEALKERIAPLAEAAGLTPHAWMVRALEEQAALAEARQQFLETGRARLAEYAQTGEAYGAEDVHRHMVARVAGRKAAEPKPVERRSRR